MATTSTFNFYLDFIFIFDNKLRFMTYVLVM